MTATRKTYNPKFKARVAVEALRGEKTLSQVGSQYKVHPMQIAKWRKLPLDQMPELRRGWPAGRIVRMRLEWYRFFAHFLRARKALALLRREFPA
jgi:transposase-like protein